MSLIIAKRDGEKIYIVGDTKLTSYPLELYPSQMVSSPQEGVVKVTIINPNICICFAGNIEGVDELIRLCRGIRSNLTRILNELLAFNKSVNGRTEFILAVSAHPLYKIFEIKNLLLTETIASWIGSHRGFSKFQEKWTFLRETQSRMGIDYHMSQALKSVIESGIEPSVNGFSIAAGNEARIFSYRSRIEMYVLPQIIPPGFSTVGHGTAQEGGYSIHFFPSNKNFTVLAVHVLQGRFGVVYKAKEGGLLWPEVFSDIDEAEFSKMTYSKFGISRLVGTPPLK